MDNLTVQLIFLGKLFQFSAKQMFPCFYILNLILRICSFNFKYLSSILKFCQCILKLLTFQTNTYIEPFMPDPVNQHKQARVHLMQLTVSMQQNQLSDSKIPHH